MNTSTAILVGVVVLAGAALAAVVLLRQEPQQVAAPPPVMTTQPVPGPGQQVGSTVDDIVRIGGALVGMFSDIFGNP